MKLLVTGGTGFIGSALCRGLLRAGHQVRVIDDDSRGSQRRLQDVAGRIEWVAGDVRRADDVLAAVNEVDGVFHLAAVNGTEFFYQKPQLVLEVAVKGMMNVLDACLSQGVRTLITASSSEVYQRPEKIPTSEDVPLVVPDPLNPRYSYGGGKIISELLTLNYGRTHFDRAIVFRPHNVYGPDMGWEHVIPQLTVRMLRCQAAAGGAREFDFPIQGDGNETRAYLYISDMVEGLLALLERGEHLNIYHLGHPHEVSIRDLVDAIAAELDVAPRLVPGPLQPGSVQRRCPDIGKACALGFRSTVNLREGLRPTVSWYRQNCPQPHPE